MNSHSENPSSIHTGAHSRAQFKRTIARALHEGMSIPAIGTLIVRPNSTKSTYAAEAEALMAQVGGERVDHIPRPAGGAQEFALWHHSAWKFKDGSVAAVYNARVEVADNESQVIRYRSGAWAGVWDGADVHELRTALITAMQRVADESVREVGFGEFIRGLSIPGADPKALRRDPLNEAGSVVALDANGQRLVVGPQGLAVVSLDPHQIEWAIDQTRYAIDRMDSALVADSTLRDALRDDLMFQSSAYEVAQDMIREAADAQVGSTLGAGEQISYSPSM